MDLATLKGIVDLLDAILSDFETYEQDNKDDNDAQESDITKKNRITLHQR